MDTSDDFLRTLKALRAALSIRHAGYWELAATAAGQTESVAQTEKGLCAEALTRAADGPALAPSLVRERVEALAAFSPDRLARLASDWKDPQEIGNDPWWTAAWSTSLRHLRAIGAIERGQVECAALSSEIELIWDGPFEREISWHLFGEALASYPVRFDICRCAARVEISERTISADNLENVSWEMLRLLRGRTALLDPTAIALLRERARTWATRDPLEAALVAELCAHVSLESNYRMREELVKAIPSMSDPRNVIPVAYVLLGAWCPP